MSSVEPTMASPSSATNGEVTPSRTWSMRSVHHAAASSWVTPARKLTAAPPSTASTSRAASWGIAARYSSASSSRIVARSVAPSVTG
jgi:hypothetical protein